jgi:hypothetical protein
MRPPLKIRRTWAKDRYDGALIDRATGEVLEHEEPIVWEWCNVCGWVDESEDGTDHNYDMCGDGRSHNGVVYGALWGDTDEAGSGRSAGMGWCFFSRSRLRSGTSPSSSAP